MNKEWYKLGSDERLNNISNRKNVETVKNFERKSLLSKYCSFLSSREELMKYSVLVKEEGTQKLLLQVIRNILRVFFLSIFLLFLKMGANLVASFFLLSAFIVVVHKTRKEKAIKVWR